MSLLGRLEGLRSCFLKCLVGIALAVALSFAFTDALWDFVKQPAKAALIGAGQPPQLMQTESMEVLSVIWFKLPLVCAVFLPSPWVLYQLGVHFAWPLPSREAMGGSVHRGLGRAIYPRAACSAFSWCFVTGSRFC